MSWPAVCWLTLPQSLCCCNGRLGLTTTMVRMRTLLLETEEHRRWMSSPKALLFLASATAIMSRNHQNGVYQLPVTARRGTQRQFTLSPHLPINAFQSSDSKHPTWRGKKPMSPQTTPKVLLYISSFSKMTPAALRLTKFHLLKEKHDVCIHHLPCENSHR